MGEITGIGVDLAKNVFQLHGAAADGSVVFRKKLSRPQFGRFMAQQPPCLVAMEACAGAHHWAREMARHGHEVRLIAPRCVKPVHQAAEKRCCRCRGDRRGDAEADHAVCRTEVGRPAGRAVAFRTREQLVKQRTEADGRISTSSAMSRPGASATCRVSRRVVDAPDADIPDVARDICRMLLEQIAYLSDRINTLKARIAAMSNEAEMPRQLQAMPDVRPHPPRLRSRPSPPMEQFRRSRDFATRLGLVQRQHSIGGKQKLEKTLKMGSAISGDCWSSARPP